MSSGISRRWFLALAAAAMVVRHSAGAEEVPGVPTDLDHILLGVSDLDHGIAWVEERSGVRAAFGGVHPGRGTRNALLALGPRRYLEIIAPDPQQAGSPASKEIWAARLNAFQVPRLIGWAVHTDDLSATAQKATSAGIAMEAPRNGSRARPDGKVLRWKSFGLKEDYGGVLPFFIEWDRDSVHPAQDAPAGCKLLQFSAESPSPKQVADDARKLGLSFNTTQGKKPVLHARISGKKGEFELS
ncbi:MAG TPA: VOC family protein [Verrucomicrobiae bacterium]|nr:VOC family protein [Verrucomicrobiae bacterium]